MTLKVKRPLGGQRTRETESETVCDFKSEPYLSIRRSPTITYRSRVLGVTN